MIKHFLSKQKQSQALIASLGGEKKSVPRKQSFLIKDHNQASAQHQQQQT